MKLATKNECRTSTPFCPIPFCPVILHSYRCCAFSLGSPYLSSIIQSISFCLGLPLPLFPSILPSIISLCRKLPLRMCPIQFFCLVLIISMTCLFLPLFQYFFIRSMFCSADPLHPPLYPHLIL